MHGDGQQMRGTSAEQNFVQPWGSLWASEKSLDLSDPGRLQHKEISEAKSVAHTFL